MNRQYRHPQAHRGDITPNLRVVKDSDTARLRLPKEPSAAGFVVLYLLLLALALAIVIAAWAVPWAGGAQ